MSAAAIEEFLSHYKTSGQLLIDSRSEGEYERGHIPGAINIPILNNEHRAIVGTIYKQKGRQEAVLKGFELSGPMFHSMMLKVRDLCKESPVMVYCWRGGMRSGILCWLLNMAGIKTTVLSGGYKRYRNWSLHQFTIDRKIIILGGRTGSGKTEMLQQLNSLGENIICLEGLASHKGSAFGALGQPEQPTQEHFENELAFLLSDIDHSKLLWLENESRNVGKIKLPDAFFDLMQRSPIIEMNVTHEIRSERILKEYGDFSKDVLAEKTMKLERRMGGENVRESVRRLNDNDMQGWLNPLLRYYDKTYSLSNDLRTPPFRLNNDVSWKEPQKEASELISKVKQYI